LILPVLALPTSQHYPTGYHHIHLKQLSSRPWIYHKTPNHPHLHRGKPVAKNDNIKGGEGYLGDEVKIKKSEAGKGVKA